MGETVVATAGLRTCWVTKCRRNCVNGSLERCKIADSFFMNGCDVSVY